MPRLLKELIEYREVLFTLVIRDIQVRYKQTIVGAVWAILQPLFMMWIFSIIFDKFYRPAQRRGPVFHILSDCFSPWIFFTNSINLAIPSLVDNESLITKIYFPREFLPLSGLCAAMLDFFIAAVIYAVILLWFKIKITAFILMVIPLFFIQILFTLGLIFFASALNVFYRDVKFIIPFVVQIGMFATPIVYSTVMISDKYKAMYMLNPLAGVIDGYRKAILSGAMPNLHYAANAFWVSLITFILGYGYFKFVENSFCRRRMTDTAVEFNNVSKRYFIGEHSIRTLRDDLNRWLSRLLNKNGGEPKGNLGA